MEGEAAGAGGGAGAPSIVAGEPREPRGGLAIFKQARAAGPTRPGCTVMRDPRAGSAHCPGPGRPPRHKAPGRVKQGAPAAEGRRRPLAAGERGSWARPACPASPGPVGPAWPWQVSKGTRPLWTRGSPAPRLLPRRASWVGSSGGPPRSPLLARRLRASGFILKHLPGAQMFSAFALAPSSEPGAPDFRVNCFWGSLGPRLRAVQSASGQVWL